MNSTEAQKGAVIELTDSHGCPFLDGESPINAPLRKGDILVKIKR